MELFYLLAGLLLGAVISWLITFYRFQASKGIPESELSVRYVLKEIHQQVQQQADIYREDLLEKEMEIRKISQELAARQQEIWHLDQRLNTQLEEMSTLQSRFQLEFENVANRLLEEKSRKFTLQNQEQLGILLQPLRDKIREFEQGIEQKYIQETKDRSALRTEIEQLHHLNQQLSKDAHNLVRALKGDSKVQGNWGESRLETLLEKAGLVKEVHFKTQATYLDTDGQMKRPDFIILLPGNKHLVVDAKVSLTALSTSPQSPCG
jgi:DNA recombination protein RmuC